ncbi:hypothetical protein HKCCE3408_00270 [Rhodobacterales bacterium HKCCE3408]|nr:hypothetical protein [Rhodobacterales bacterium HKCCE3408]
MNIVKSLWLALALLVLPVTAQAALLSSIQLQTVNNQTFSFVFNGAPLSNGSDGTLTITARGDYGRLDTEVLTYDIEGVTSGGPYGGFPDVLGAGPDYGGVGGPFDSATIFSLNPDDYQFTKSVTVSGSDLLAITADGQVVVDVFAGADVTNLNDLSFVEVELSYDEEVAEGPGGEPNNPGGGGEVPAIVPLPATMIPALSALGLVGLIGWRRRRA